MDKRKTVIKIIFFVFVMSAVLLSADKVLLVKYPDGIYSMKRFYELKDNTVDVLFIGNSHAFETYNTSVMWDSHGISSYVLAGSQQPTWNTYFFLKEALKTQKPDVIVMDAVGCICNFDYTDDPTQMKNCYGMKPSLNKIEAMCVSSSLDRMEFFVPISNYSSRYSELSAEDFLGSSDIPKYKYWMGFASNYKNEAFETPRLQPADETIPMGKKTEKYYRKILELAKEKNIPVVVVVTPYPCISTEDAAYFKSAENIAKEYNAAFLNPALDPASIGLDFKRHASDDSHLNAEGNRIYTAYFADYLKSHYEIPDRRGDPAYLDWEKCSEYLKRMDSNYQLRTLNDYESICRHIKAGQYSFFAIVGENCTNASEILSPLGMKDCKADSVYFYSDGQTELLFKEADTISYRDIYLRFHNDLVYSDRNRLAEKYTAGANTVKIVVYDRTTDDICDVFSIDGRDLQKLCR